jgi:hypothetical protein
MRNTPGLILDIRDNSGGFSHSRIVGRFLQKRTQTVVSFIKNGPDTARSVHNPGLMARRARGSTPAVWRCS